MYDEIEDLGVFPLFVDGKIVKPLYLNVCGKAGCGKSFVLKICRKHYLSEDKPDFMKIGGPTGSAAFLVKGTTLHKMLKLKINNSQGPIKDLKGKALEDLQTAFEDVHLLVIDEKSMIGQYMLYMIDRRLREAKPTQANLPFGGVSVVLMGDFGQLVPVKDPPLYAEHEEGSKWAKNPQINAGKHLYKSLFVKNTIILDEVMRQGKGQERFKETLERLRDGKFNKEDWDYFKDNCELQSPKYTEEERNAVRSSAIKVCALNRDLKNHNLARIKALGQPLAKIKSDNEGKGSGSAPAREAGNLLPDIVLAKGCRILLSTNLWQPVGLTNGAVGTVKYIIYKENEAPLALPAFLLCHFDQYIGPSFIEGEEKLVPIAPVTRTWYPQPNVIASRTMLPMKPGYAISIHASQGETLHKVIVDLGPREFAVGLTYVACSRVKSIEDLFFEKMPHVGRFNRFSKSKSFIERFNYEQGEKEAEAKFVASIVEKREKKKDN